jgi:uncharacterized protein YxjI
MRCGSVLAYPAVAPVNFKAVVRPLRHAVFQARLGHATSAMIHSLPDSHGRYSHAEPDRGELTGRRCEWHHPIRGMRWLVARMRVQDMGFLRRNDGPDGERFVMREKLLSIGDDFWIENGEGERAYKVNGKALRARKTFVLEDAAGQEIARIQERKLSIRDKIAIERDGETTATVHKALVGIRDRFAIDVEHGADMKAHGNVVDHEYEIERDGDTVAMVSKKWFRVRDSYGVDVAPGEDTPLILAITVAIDSLTTRD